MLIGGKSEKGEHYIKLGELRLREFIIKKSASKQTSKQKIGGK